MTEIFWEALKDNLKLLPWLFGVYLLVSVVETRMDRVVHSRLAAHHAFGPLLGMLLGLLPQCGFSVVAAGLYSARLITVGTLVAVFLATSDEAIPILLSQPERLSFIVPLIVGKAVVAVVGGYALDLAFGKAKFAPEACGHDHEHGHDVGCCEHDLPSTKRGLRVLAHPLRHTLTVFVFCFATSLVLGSLIYFIGEPSLDTLLLRGSCLQPVLAALLGLIPSCAISVILTQALLAGHLSFGAAMAGLCSSGGLGLLILARESHRPRDLLRVVASLLAISISAGLLIQGLRL